MGFGEPKMPTPKEMVEMQKERTLHDSKMLDKGAKYVTKNDEDLRLDATKAQINKAKESMDAALFSERMTGFFEKLNEEEQKMVEAYVHTRYLLEDLTTDIYPKAVETLGIQNNESKRKFLSNLFMMFQTNGGEVAFRLKELATMHNIDEDDLHEYANFRLAEAKEDENLTQMSKQTKNNRTTSYSSIANQDLV